MKYLDTSTLIARFMLSEDRVAAEEINRRIPTNALCGEHQGQVAPCLLCLQAQVTRDYHDLKALREHVEAQEPPVGPREKGTQLVAAPPSPPSSDAGVAVSFEKPTSPTTPGRRPEEVIIDTLVAMVRRANREVKDAHLHQLINDDLEALLKEIER